MTDRDEKLKKRLLSAILYHRLVELGFDAEDPRNVRYLDWTMDGWTKLERAVKEFFRARDRDLLGYNDDASTFLRYVAVLMEEIGRPRHVFGELAIETAVSVVGRLLRFEGWNAADPRFDAWKDSVYKTTFLDSKTRVQQFYQLFKRDWEYRVENVLQFEDAFEEEELWMNLLIGSGFSLN